MSTAKHNLDRQIDALEAVGIQPHRIYLYEKSGSTGDRPGMHAALAYARTGDVIVVHTLDRLGATGRRIGRPSAVNPNQLDYARRLGDESLTMAEIVEKTGITRASLYRHLPPRTGALILHFGGFDRISGHSFRVRIRRDYRTFSRADLTRMPW